VKPVIRVDRINDGFLDAYNAKQQNDFLEDLKKFAASSFDRLMVNGPIMPQSTRQRHRQGCPS
jgi:hypothetical protein